MYYGLIEKNIIEKRLHVENTERVMNRNSEYILLAGPDQGTTDCRSCRIQVQQCGLVILILLLDLTSVPENGQSSQQD